jgi:hypothetical protein
MAKTKTVRAADLKVYINGQLFAICTGLRWSASTGRRAINGIDQNTPFELAPGSTSIRGTMEVLRLHQDGGLEGWGVAAPQSELLKEKYFSLAVVDRVNDTVILAASDCAIGDQSWQVTARGELTGSFTFEALDWNNEAQK